MYLYFVCCLMVVFKVMLMIMLSLVDRESYHPGGGRCLRSLYRYRLGPWLKPWP